jgi:high affinity Mn2+ porin
MRAPYQGAHSLPGGELTANTLDASLIAGARPWKGAQLWFDEDMNQGFAPADTLGVAGFVNGEGVKVGHHSPYYRPQRYFPRQTIELGGGTDKVDPDMMEFGGATTKNRIVVTVGKFSLTDVMDDNAYAHEPKNDFLNWAIIDTGSWDYAADAWGFSEGGVIEWVPERLDHPWRVHGPVYAAERRRTDARFRPVPVGRRDRASPALAWS